MDSKASPIEFDISDYKPDTEPFYIDVNGETEIFKAAYKERIPVIKGLVIGLVTALTLAVINYGGFILLFFKIFFVRPQ